MLTLVSNPKKVVFLFLSLFIAMEGFQMIQPTSAEAAVRKGGGKRAFGRRAKGGRRGGKKRPGGNRRGGRGGGGGRHGSFNFLQSPTTQSPWTKVA